MTYIGIDPGKSGAIAAIYRGELIAVEDMPLDEGEIDIPTLVRMRDIDPDFVVWVEDVHSMPGQGVRSTFSFGRSKGIVEGVFSTEDSRPNLVSPQTWKRHFGLLKQDKSASRELAMKLFPKEAKQFKRAKDDGRAEAALIALYGLQISGGKR
jgi:crossover junction endodeoxyribonuclease RuvC